jgi:hypothetical protein
MTVNGRWEKGGKEDSLDVLFDIVSSPDPWKDRCLVDALAALSCFVAKFLNGRW